MPGELIGLPLPAVEPPADSFPDHQEAPPLSGALSPASGWNDHDQVIPPVRKPNARLNLILEERHAVYEFLLQRLNASGQPKRGSMSAAAAKLSVHAETVSRIWKRAVESTASGSIAANVSSRKLGRVGQKKALNLDRVKDIPFCQRSNIVMVPF
jgi:hypothetical protein